IALGVDAWNLPGDHRGIGRYLRAILREWRQWASDRVEVTLIVPEWHTWTVRGRYLREVDRARYRVVSRRLHARAGLDWLLVSFQRLQLDAVLAAGGRDAARCVEFCGAGLCARDASDLSRRGGAVQCVDYGFGLCAAGAGAGAWDCAGAVRCDSARG